VKEKTRQKWQQGLRDYVEPGEHVEAAIRGVGAKFWQLVLIVGWVLAAALKLYRTYVVTDRNVYVFRASSWSTYKATELLEKRPLGEARVEFRRGYLTVNGMHRGFVGRFGPIKQRALTVVEAAGRAPAPAAQIPPEPTATI
jgi:hypothetical protein